MKYEAKLKAALVKAFPSDYYVLAISDQRKYGIPDLVPSGHGRTSWLELKHATPRFSTMEVQEITCMQLAKYSFCRYVIYHEHLGVQSTLIVHPRHVHLSKGLVRGLIFEVSFPGFDHRAVVNYVRTFHETGVA